MSKKPPAPTGAEKAAQRRRDEEEARNELFAGKDEVVIDPNAATPLDQQSVQQLVNTAVRTHKDTTATAARALKVVEEAQQVQRDTMGQLAEQNKKMYDISRGMDQMNEELTYAEKLLSYMRRCCCCWMCDSCTGADPEEARKRDWERRVAKGKTQVAKGVPGAGKGGAGAAGAGGKGGTAGGKGAGPSRLGDPDIQLPEEHRAAEMGMHEETRKQNAMIDQIQAGLEGLLAGAKEMTDELTTQNRQLDGLDTKAEATKGRIDDVNKNSQLRNMVLKKK
ncbi:hypothetical protein HYH03_016856 [Edaphochlamys debaryana]|uniref:Synaptosomal-associated protein n=1 Tax=Edaphochlamys debaryana TaxID=47281 RepID=A0A836BR13_9CHLO|nr:hypothetical protein HYH03_016856 [Edaphochlamys debaryana]|eukprot:KAG2484314.1 hypothetical protein HYH03_016856 [Edaphochlamys debaryana]